MCRTIRVTVLFALIVVTDYLSHIVQIRTAKKF
nr:MAG TPA: hypothetical protein [Caudoviricetes sp.]